ncbi:uncharacterized protein LOC103057593 [Python bivittatus]|uniref:Uncharacterized protein LOC103057593 n=1 Tax=Python bivittatus TaxID=176946 RepID=A0A9F3QTW2_PYTBI|nr:uncharacterized protein LOC103057593 [Python bivittatus]
MMFASSLHLLLLLTITWPTAQATNPDCSHVADFGNCVGDTVGFCPKGIACGCKSQIPYCKCPSYRNKWEDYWYMGPKFDYLWSTLDLILVIAVPAATLAIVATTLMQWVGYCKSKPKGSRSQARRPAPVISHRPQPHGQLKVQAKEMFAFPRPLVPNQQETPFPERLSYPPQRPTSITDEAFMVPSAQVGRSSHWANEIPDADYEQQNPFAPLPMRQLSKPKTPMFPLPDYDENSSQPMNAKMPSRFVHPQYMYN